jgi:division protein 1
MVKVVQVEETLCITGGADGSVRLWDLRRVEDYEQQYSENNDAVLGRISERRESDEYDWNDGPSGISQSTAIDNGPCVRTLEGHSKTVTALYYEEGTLARCAVLSTITELTVTGHRILRQDYAPMGRRNWPMCTYHGHSMGHFKPASRERGQPNPSATHAPIIDFIWLDTL